MPTDFGYDRSHARPPVPRRDPGELDIEDVDVTTSEASLFSTEDVTVRSLGGPALVVPIDPLVVRIQRHMLPTAAGAMQTALPFPHRVVQSGT